MINSADLLSTFFTPRLTSALLPAFYFGYDMAVTQVNSVDFLRWLKPQILPYLKNLAVEYELFRRCREGRLPFECNLVPNSRRNHSHIELHNESMVFTVSQVQRVTKRPRFAEYRNDLNIDGQIAMEGFEPDVSKDKKIYAILTHGHSEEVPHFVCCGIPSHDNGGWDQQINLMLTPHEISSQNPASTADEIMLGFKEYLTEIVPNS